MATEMELVAPSDPLPFEEQQELLDVTLYARQLGVEELVRERSCLPVSPTDCLKGCSNQRTGKILLKQLRNDPEYAEALCSALALGMSAKMVAKRFCISPESVAIIREAMTDRGELRPVRLRVQAKIDRLAEDGLDETWHGMMADRIHPGQGWIPTLATVDKRAQAEAGMVPGTERTVEAVTLERLMAARELVLQHRRQADVGSDVISSETIDTTSTIATHRGFATAPATGTPALVASEPGISHRVRLEPSEAGGGIGSSPSSKILNRTGAEISQPKEGSG